MAFLLSGGSCSVACPPRHHRRFIDRRGLGHHSRHPLDASPSAVVPWKPSCQPHRGTPLMVSLQEPLSTVTSPQELPPDQSSNVQDQELQAETGRPKGRVKKWVNPKSLRRINNNSRYPLLRDVAKMLSDLPSPTVDDIAKTLAAADLDSPSERYAISILDNINNSSSALATLRWFVENVEDLNRSVKLYNVTFKVMRKCKDWESTESLLTEMISKGLKPDNITFSTVIICARLCNQPEKAVKWFETMPVFGCEPDAVSYSAMISAYGSSGKVDMALSLYDRARKEHRGLDAITLSTIIKIHAISGNFDGALNIFEEMKELGMLPNRSTYNVLLDAMGRADRPWKIRTIHNEMTKMGISPNWATYAALLQGYCRARYHGDAFSVYQEMKEKGLKLNVVLYNTLLSMCADMGLVDEAFEIFEHMKSSPNGCKPDSWTYSALMTIYSCSGRVSEAESILNQMEEAGMKPTLFILTSLIQCYGNAKQADNIVKTFDRVIELGIVPDERFCGCLLNVMTQISEDDLAKVIDCIDRSNPKLGQLVKHLLDEENSNDFFRSEAEQVLIDASKVVKKPYCNCLINLCFNMGLLERACILLDLGQNLGIYEFLQSKSALQWSLHVKSLSLGAALVALHIWMNDLSKALKDGEELPPVLGIQTGHGKHKYSVKGLAASVESHLRELNAPFYESTDKPGWFLTTKVAAESWLKSRASSEMAGS